MSDQRIPEAPATPSRPPRRRRIALSVAAAGGFAVLAASMASAQGVPHTMAQLSAAVEGVVTTLNDVAANVRRIAAALGTSAGPHTLSTAALPVTPGHQVMCVVTNLGTEAADVTVSLVDGFGDPVFSIPSAFEPNRSGGISAPVTFNQVYRCAAQTGGPAHTLRLSLEVRDANNQILATLDGR